MSYRIAATSSSQARHGVDLAADSEEAALDMARGKSIEHGGVSFGVFEVRSGEGAFIIASFLNGERRFTAASWPADETDAAHLREFGELPPVDRSREG